VVTAPKQDAEFLQVANAFSKVRSAHHFFAFAIKFCTFNKVFRLRQFSAFKFRTSLSCKTLVPIIMTIEELHNKLTELKIPADQYYLQGLYGSTDDNDKVALTMKRGKYTIE
jgi:hypothetical protein